MEKVLKSDQEWREQLDDEQFDVTRKAGTERAFSGCFWDTKTEGTYRCVCCDQELFNSEPSSTPAPAGPAFTHPPRTALSRPRPTTACSCAGPR